MRTVQFFAIFTALALGVGAASLDRAPTRLQLQMAPPDDSPAQSLPGAAAQDRLAPRTERKADAIPAAAQERTLSRETDPFDVIAKNPNER
jgi:hypothetical protein